MVNNNSEILDVMETTSVVNNTIEDVLGISPSSSDIWKKHFDPFLLELDQDVAIETLAALYPLSETEIISIVGYLNTNHPEGKISYDAIGASILHLLEKEELALRLDVMRMSAENLQDEMFACAAAKDACGHPHQCGQPYECGPDFACGTPFECSTPFEIVPCVSSEIHCAHHDHNMDNPDNE